MQDVLTTGEAARICGVNFRTVLRWIDRGLLPAYKLPGRGDRRVLGTVGSCKKTAYQTVQSLVLCPGAS